MSSLISKLRPHYSTTTTITTTTTTTTTTTPTATAEQAPTTKERSLKCHS